LSDHFNPEHTATPGVSVGNESHDRELQRSNNRPCWDTRSQCLYFQAKLIKEFRQVAENQTVVLDAFEQSGWEEVIDNPLPTSPFVDRLEQLYETVKSLNRSMRRSSIHFHTVRQGTAIRWRVQNNSKAQSLQIDAI
jgi:hypothetical protein